MTPEVQGAKPRLLHRLIPFKRVEQYGTRREQKTSTPLSTQREPQKESTQPRSYQEYLTQSGRRLVTIFYGETPTQADKEYITQTYTEYLTRKYTSLTQSDIEYFIGMELKGNTPPPIIVDGKEMSGLEYWDYVQEKKEREKQEAIARREFPDINNPMPLVQENLHFDSAKPLTPDQERVRNRSIIMSLRGQFVTEIKKADIDLIAEDIRSNMWKGSSMFTELRPAIKGKITIKQDGTIINRLRSGLALSYPSLDEHGKLTAKPDRKQTLSMGIGYFGEEDKANIITDAQGIIPPEDLKKGIKGYFIERTYIDVTTMKQKTYMTIIPFAYANSLRTFYEHLADSAIFYDPRRFIPLPRRLRYRTPMQAAA